MTELHLHNTTDKLFFFRSETVAGALAFYKSLALLTLKSLGLECLGIGSQVLDSSTVDFSAMLVVYLFT